MKEGLHMEILIAAFTILVAAVLLYLLRERNTYTNVLEQLKLNSVQSAELNKRLSSSEKSVDALRTTVMSFRDQIDAAHDHCTKIWDQTQIHSKNIGVLKTRVATRKIDINILETTQPKQKRVIQ